MGSFIIHGYRWPYQCELICIKIFAQSSVYRKLVDVYVNAAAETLVTSPDYYL